MSTTEEYHRIAHQPVHVKEAHGNANQKIVTPITVKLTLMVTTELLMVVSTLILEVVNMYWPNHVAMMTSLYPSLKQLLTQTVY